MTILAIIIGAVVGFVAVYAVTHYFLPSWGTLITNGIAGAGMLVDGVSVLPWGTVLEPKHAAYVAFAIAMANMLIRLRGAKGPVGSGR